MKKGRNQLPKINMADNKEMEVSSVTKCQKFKYPLNLEKARDLG